MRTTSAVKAIGMIVVILFGYSNPQQVGHGQSVSAVEWTDYENISNTPTASTYPTIVGDRAGNVHVFWTENAGGDTENLMVDPNGNPVLDNRGKQINYLVGSGNTLYYTRWNGRRWMRPIDFRTILNGSILFPSATIDPKGVLHVIWSEGVGVDEDLMYSQVPVDQAMDPRAWSVPFALGGPILSAYYSASIIADSLGGLHVIYNKTRSAPGIYVLNSSDGGMNWSSPVFLYANVDEAGVEDGSLPLQMTIDAKDRLHATWTRYDSTGNGKAIFYSQSIDSGQTWTEPYKAASWQTGYYEVDWLSVGVVGDKIYLEWEGGPTARMNERISTDGGTTWSDERWILPKLVGENGWADLLVDSNNRLYQIATKRIGIGMGDAVYGTWFIPMVGSQWETPQMLGVRNNYDLYNENETLTPAGKKSILYNTINGDGLRYQRSVIVNGNELFVVVVNEFDGEIYSARTQLDAPHVAPQPYPTVYPTPSPTAADSDPVALANINPTLTVSIDDLENGRQPILSGGLFLLSLIPVGLLVAFFIAFRFMKKKD